MKTRWQVWFRQGLGEEAILFVGGLSAPAAKRVEAALIKNFGNKGTKFSAWLETEKD